jgi:hypothetical protein
MALDQDEVQKVLLSGHTDGHGHGPYLGFSMKTAKKSPCTALNGDLGLNHAC